MCSVGHHQFYLLVNTFTEIMSFLGQFLYFHFHEAELLHLWSIFIVSSSWCFEFFKKMLFLPAIVLVDGIRENLYFFLLTLLAFERQTFPAYHLTSPSLDVSFMAQSSVLWHINLCQPLRNLFFHSLTHSHIHLLKVYIMWYTLC